MIPRQQLIYNTRSGKYTLKDADLDIARARTRGKLNFRDDSVREILLTLERRFDVVFQYSNGKFNKDKYNIRFRVDTDIEEAISLMNQLVGPVRYEITGKTCIIY